MWLVGLGFRFLGRSFVPAKFFGARIWARELNGGREIWANEAEFVSFAEKGRGFGLALFFTIDLARPNFYLAP